MEIKGFQELSFLDWPGKNPAIIFLNHCNFRCQYCHNIQLACGIEGQNIPPAYVLAKLRDRREWIEHIVISGGEPTLNKSLVEFCRDLKNFLNIGIKLDTNGSNPHLLGILLNENLIDKVSMDVKAPLDEERYSAICGTQVNVADIEQSINLICDSAIQYEFRTTISPDFLPEEEILEIACELSCICSKIQEYTLQNFDPSNTKLKARPYNIEMLNQIKYKILKDCDVKCTIKGA